MGNGSLWSNWCYGCLVVYLQCSNNKAETVYNLFLKDVQQYGLPLSLVSDQGKENYVAVHMFENRGCDRNNMIIGSSVHNKRIVEWLWRDIDLLQWIFTNCLLPQTLRTSGSWWHIPALCIEYVYLPHINKSLQLFFRGLECLWKIQMAWSLSPNQLLVKGTLQMHRK